jgi:hypothetical protein
MKLIQYGMPVLFVLFHIMASSGTADATVAAKLFALPYMEISINVDFLPVICMHGKYRSVGWCQGVCQDTCTPAYFKNISVNYTSLFPSLLGKVDGKKAVVGQVLAVLHTLC